jgi:hypothetical protein
MKNKLSKIESRSDEPDRFMWDIIMMSFRYFISNGDFSDGEYLKKLTVRFWARMTDGQRDFLMNEARREVFDHDFWLKEESRKKLEEWYDSMSTFNQYPVKQFKLLDSFDFEMLRMAIHYACPRQTILSASFPADVIKYRYHVLTKEHKQVIVADLKAYLQRSTNGIFGNPNIDDKPWRKFMHALNENEHFQVVFKSPALEENSTAIVFRCLVTQYEWDEEARINKEVTREMTYPLDSYLEQPQHEIFIPTEWIIQ